MTRKIYRPTVLTLAGLAATIAAIAGTAGFILGRAPMLGEFVPVHFTDQGVPDRWLPISFTLVLLPVWIQLVLAIVFGSIGTMLLYRTHPLKPADRVVEDDVTRQNRERMLVTAEAVSLLCAIWVTFQGLAALRILWLWQQGFGGLGNVYMQSLVVAIVLSAIVGVRAGVNLHHPTPANRPSEDGHWRFKALYFNPEDPALFVPVRNGVGWTVNFGRPRAVVFLVIFVALGVGAPLFILKILLGE
jgi:uncharacterized membrane protein